MIPCGHREYIRYRFLFESQGGLFRWARAGGAGDETVAMCVREILYFSHLLLILILTQGLVPSDSGPEEVLATATGHPRTFLFKY